MEGRKSQHRTRAPIRHVAIILEAARYSAHYSGVSTLTEGDERAARVDFDELKADPVQTIRSALGHIEVSSAGITESGFRPNSSFLYRDEISKYRLGKIERTASSILQSLFASAPPVARAILKLRDRTRGDRSMLYRRLTKAEHFSEEFRDELEREGNIGLGRLLEEMNQTVSASAP